MRVRSGSRELQEAVARNYFNVLAYKDEYEVARLHTAHEFVDSIRRNFGTDARMSFNFSPPLFARLDPATGRPKKYEFGPWIVPVLRVLAGLKRIRGTWLDPFRYSADRRLERELLRRYEAALDRIEAELTESRFDVAVRIARLPHEVRGYGPIKRAAAERAVRSKRGCGRSSLRLARNSWSSAYARRRGSDRHGWREWSNCRSELLPSGAGARIRPPSRSECSGRRTDRLRAGPWESGPRSRGTRRTFRS